VSQGNILIVQGRLEGSIECTQSASWGYFTINPGPNGDIFFEASIPVKNEGDIDNLVGLVPVALRAFISVGWAVSVRPTVSGWEFSRPDGTKRMGIQISSSFHVLADLAQLPDGGVLAASNIQKAVLEASEPRLAEIAGIFGLGLDAAAHVAPVAGVWAFANIIEEDSAKQKNIDHAGGLAASLRTKGYAISVDPIRQPSRIRVSALHPTPKDPLPDGNEVRWLMEIARAYLADRASEA
jgi:hypothetical protein